MAKTRKKFISPALITTQHGIPSASVQAEGPTTNVAYQTMNRSTSYYTVNGQRAEQEVPVALRKAGFVGDNGLKWMLSDHLGSTSVVANASGASPATQGYMPWGETRYGSVPTNYQYTGQFIALVGKISLLDAKLYAIVCLLVMFQRIGIRSMSELENLLNLKDCVAGVVGYPVMLVYVYGSTARNQATPLSDVDIALVVDPADFALEERLKLELEIEDKLVSACGISNLEVRIVNDAPIVIRGDVVTEGFLLYSREEEFRIEFETRTRMEYFDFLPVAQTLARASLKFIQEHGLRYNGR